VQQGFRENLIRQAFEAVGTFGHGDPKKEMLAFHFLYLLF
jgi:hypothetical protein